MVNVVKGVLVTCDPAMKQFLLYLDEKNSLGTRFIIQDLDETHLFISEDAVRHLKSQIDDLMDKISVPVVEVGGFKPRGYRIATMIRRPPTRLELKMDDIKEYEQMKSESRKNMFGQSPSHNSTTNEGNTSLTTASNNPPTSAERIKAMYSRIGFDPKPRKPT